MAILINHLYGFVAQSGERQPVTLEVVGSKPIRVAIKVGVLTLCLATNEDAHRTRFFLLRGESQAKVRRAQRLVANDFWNMARW